LYPNIEFDTERFPNLPRMVKDFVNAQTGIYYDQVTNTGGA